jgi:hypothetical protein
MKNQGFDAVIGIVKIIFCNGQGGDDKLPFAEGLDDIRFGFPIEDAGTGDWILNSLLAGYDLEVFKVGGSYDIKNSNHFISILYSFIAQ